MSAENRVRLFGLGTVFRTRAQRRESRTDAADQCAQFVRFKGKSRIRPAVGPRQRDVLFNHAGAERTPPR